MRRTISTLSTTSLAVLASIASGDAHAAVGGPDAFGYTFVDQADGAAYDYVDITTTGLLLATGDESISPVLPLTVPFELYGELVTEVVVSTNGFIGGPTTVNPDFNNECPLPSTFDSGFHIAPLHDDLFTSVYYQYFNEVQAAALGYPDQVAGISVFQWDGQHFAGPANDFVDAEVILFHTDGSILTMVAADAENGVGSTQGIQNSSGTVGLTYSCDAAGGTIPGVTAVLYSPPRIVINELRIDNTGTDVEFFEIAGPPGQSLDGMHYLVVGDGAGGSGVIEASIDLGGHVIPPSGYFVAGEPGFPGADLGTELGFENNDTVTHMLVTGFTGAINFDIDTDDDGVPDSIPWETVVDAVAIVYPPSLELPYGPGATCTAGPTCQQLTQSPPGHVFRCADTTGAFNPGSFDLAVVPLADSPGQPNPCACGDGILLLDEDCDEGGETATCDADCTLPACGDGLLNASAGESCDDAGESATCNADCTPAMCGDGIVNMTAGELCDDIGESAACNADCTVAACGDGIVNMAAGETCDDAGESATCDLDCTAVACGDGVTNATAGEECDDAGESATCDLDCTAAMCGDLVVNTTAGETCDEGGRSATCNADCTAATCGDGMVNPTAGEECDGDGMGMPGQTATCDDDCTTAMCGDAVVNAAAGEDCDDGAASATCDDDCTTAECGDGTVNAAAGEDCDDGNTEDGDGCAADCTMELEPGSTGDSGSDDTTGLDTGLDDTAGDVTTSSGGDTGDTSGGPGPSTLGGTNDSTGGDGDTDTDSGGAVPVDDDGCSCSTARDGADDRQRRSAAWSVLALLGLGALRRRRHRG